MVDGFTLQTASSYFPGVPYEQYESNILFIISQLQHTLDGLNEEHGEHHIPLLKVVQNCAGFAARWWFESFL